MRAPRAPHLLRVASGPEPFAPLLAAMSAAGLRAGWLELGPAPPALAGLGDLGDLGDLETAASLGVLRAVAAGGDRSIVCKPLRGAPVLRDLLREHFRGCALVLVRAGSGAAVPLAELPALSPAGDGWRVAPEGDAAAQLYDTPSLLAALRRPRPWAGSVAS